MAPTKCSSDGQWAGVDGLGEPLQFLVLSSSGLWGDGHETAVMLACVGKALPWFVDLQMNTKGLILYTLHIQPHYVFGTRSLSSPSPLLFLGAEQCF